MSDTPTDAREGPIRNALKSRWRGMLLGLTGGFVGTVSMSSFREPAARAYPPTAEFWAKYVSDDEPEDHPLPAFVLHLLYGTVAGGAFGALVGTADDRSGPDADADEGAGDEIRRWTILGALYGLVLSELGLHLLLRGVNDQELTADERFLFHIGHLVYGVTLGTWCGYRD